MAGKRSRPPDEGRLLQLIYYAYVAGSRIALALPERVAYGAARYLGMLAARFSRKRSQVARNLSRVVGEDPSSKAVQRLVTEAFISYARYWLETFRLVREGREFFLERFTCHGVENLDRVMERHKGAVVMVGHLGNWDVAGAWVGATGRRIVTVAEVLRPQRMFDFFAEHRARLGMTIYPAESGVTDRLVEAVGDGAIVALVGDRDLKGSGPKISFFGEPTTFPGGPASVALRTGVPLLVAGVYGLNRPDGTRVWEAIFSEPIELPPEEASDKIQELTQRAATAFEDMVARRPEEWHVFQPFWLADRDK